MCMSYQSRGIIRNSMVPLTNLDKGGVVTRPSRVTRGRVWLCITWCRKNGRHIIPLRYMNISNSIDKHTQSHKQHRYTHTHTHTHTHIHKENMQLTNEIICTQALGDVLSVCVCVCLDQALLCTESPQSGSPLRVGYNPDYSSTVSMFV